MNFTADESTLKLKFEEISKYFENENGIILLTDKNRKINTSELEKVKLNKSNLYCIYSKTNQQWKKVYIGMSLSKYFNSRMNQHFIQQSDGTHSVFNKIMHAMQLENIGIKTAFIEPESLRHYFENVYPLYYQ